MKLIHSILVLMCCFTAVAYGNECCQSNCEMTSPEACPESNKCPQDSHPTGTNCPHQDPSPS